LIGVFNHGSQFLAFGKGFNHSGHEENSGGNAFGMGVGVEAL